MAKTGNKQIKLQPRYRESSCGLQIVPWLTVSGVWLLKMIDLALANKRMKDNLQSIIEQ